MSIVALFLSIVIWGVIFWVLWWALNTIDPAEPFKKIGVVLLVLATVAVIIGLLTGSILPFPIVSSLHW